MNAQAENDASFRSSSLEPDGLQLGPSEPRVVPPASGQERVGEPGLRDVRAHGRQSRIPPAEGRAPKGRARKSRRPENAQSEKLSHRTASASNGSEQNEQPEKPSRLSSKPSSASPSKSRSRNLVALRRGAGAFASSRPAAIFLLGSAASSGSAHHRVYDTTFRRRIQQAVHDCIARVLYGINIPKTKTGRIPHGKSIRPRYTESWKA
jgi:hypothetical protein